MEIKIEIPNKLYNEILELCSYNNISFDDYIFDSIMDNYNSLIHVNLNEKIKEKEEKNIIKPKIEKVKSKAKVKEVKTLNKDIIVENDKVEDVKTTKENNVVEENIKSATEGVIVKKRILKSK